MKINNIGSENIKQDEKVNDKIEGKDDIGSFSYYLEKYREPVRAAVHFGIQCMIFEEFENFMEDRIGMDFIRGDKIIKDYRNGYRTRESISTSVGPLEDLRIPRNRLGGFVPAAIPRKKRVYDQMAELVTSLFINGVATRGIRRAFQRVYNKCLPGISNERVSNITRSLIEDYNKWIKRPIQKEFTFLIADAIYLSLKRGTKSREALLSVIGITDEGQKEFLFFQFGGTEKSTSYDEIFLNLKNRGLNFKNVKNITIDGSPGLISSAISHFGEKKVQRCTVHKTENILDKVSDEYKAEVKGFLNRIWNSQSKSEAIRKIKDFAETYSEKFPGAVACLIQDKDSLLRYYNFPSYTWKSVRNTNLIERSFKEVRRRTKPMDILSSEDGALKIIFGIVENINVRWERKSHWKKMVK